MSDSEDDFMSDKFLVEAPPPDTTYSSRRRRAAAASSARARANETRPLWEREAAARREGLSRSLFDTAAEEKGKTESGQAKAMGLMQKMGWKVGEGLGRRRSASPERGSSGDADKQAGGKADRERGREREEEGGEKAGLGGRAEPIRISLWAGRRGLAARSPSPPPPPARGEISAARQRELDAAAGRYRGVRGAEAEARDVERKGDKARELLIEMDAEKGIKFHPLHARPGMPDSLPRPLLRLLYPDMSSSPGASPSSPPASPPLGTATALGWTPSSSASAAAASTRRNNVNKAAALREQMRRDMLSELGGELGDADEESVRFGVPAVRDTVKEEAKADAAEEAAVDWAEMVRGTRRVLAMTPGENLAYLVSQLRNEHMFCFWCGSRYGSFAEMDGPGGCPGEEEDDH